MARRTPNRAGYTLIEIGVVIVLTGIIFSFVYANYRRSNQDSLLQRETSLLMSRIRLAQEETAVGKTFRYCSKPTGIAGVRYYSGMLCAVTAEPSAECDDPIVSMNSACSSLITPRGGFGLTFSCGLGGATYESVSPYGKLIWPTLSKLAQTHYYEFADLAKFTGNHYPADHTNLMETEVADRKVVYHEKHTKYRGDTLIADYALSSNVEIHDVYLREEGSTNRFHCLAESPWQNYKFSPWNQATIPVPDSAGDVNYGFPLQASVFFDAPDGRTVTLSDNIYTATPPAGKTNVNTLGNVWAEIGVMLKLKDRTRDCKVVKVTRSGTISSTNDEDCTFAT